jgi:hypothetical protein
MNAGTNLPLWPWFLVVTLGWSELARAGDRDVVINEIMYHPPGDREDLQFLELFNRGSTAVDLSGWRFTKGLKFSFPGQLSLASGDFVVVCRDLAAFRDHYGNRIPAVGDFTGRLSRGGERIELSDARGDVVERVKYADREPWPVAPDGLGSSLERICPFAEAWEAEDWAPSELPPVERAAGTPGRQNGCFTTNPPPVVKGVTISRVEPGKPAAVTASVGDDDGVKSVALCWHVVRSGTNLVEAELAMRRMSGNDQQGGWKAEIPAQPAGELIRFRIEAADSGGNRRIDPSPNEPYPSFSYSTSVNTNSARVAFVYLHQAQSSRQPIPPMLRNTRLAQTMTPNRGHDAFLYAAPGEAEVRVFDHVRLVPRSGGFKVYFPKGREFDGMTTINVIFEDEPRRVLSEWLSYELYRLAGVPAPRAEHVRVWRDDRLRGYMLMFEQPNKSFLRRHQRDDSGNLYKLIWQGSGIVGQHEKKTNLSKGHDDLIEVIEGLARLSGAAQWDFIQRHFNVEEFINYYAVNMCIQNWDGFHNNYFAYHDTGGTGKWEVYPWDEDKTWGDYDGASSRYDWYDMPLTFAMQTGRWDIFARRANWWRPGGWFGAPLLSNPEFRKRFLVRLRGICDTIFTEKEFGPVIEAMEKRLEPEVAVRAAVLRWDTREAGQEFRSDVQSFRNQLVNRRKFLIRELDKLKVGR